MRARKLFIEVLEDRRVLTADFSNNSQVDAPDLSIWKANFGTVGTATQAQGDADADMDVDGNDFLVWQRTLGQVITPTSPSINVILNGSGEGSEESTGAIVFRNSDFSKQSLATNQPEAGLPLYVPDYSAPASVFDPNAPADFTPAALAVQAAMVGTHQIRFTYNDTRIRLWTTTNWTGFVDMGGGRYRIPTGVNFTPTGATLNFQIEGLQNSTAFATDSILVQAIPTAGGTTLQDSSRYTVIETNVGVDGNRDTAIDFASSHDRQLLFWVNNDQEGFNPNDEDIETDVVNITAPDHGNNVINQRRDLEDFAPLRLQVDALLFNNAQDVKLGAIPPNQLSVRYSLDYLGSDGESFRLFYANNFQADVYRHVNNETTATVQATDETFRNSERPAFTGNHVLEATLSGLNPYLFEMRHGTLPYGVTFHNDSVLVFVTEVFYPDGTSLQKRHEINLDIRDIKSFYTNWDIPYLVGPNDLRTDVSFEHFATPSVPTALSENRAALGGQCHEAFGQLDDFSR